MSEDIKDLLDEEIENQLEGLSNLEQGSKEHSIAVENLNTLYKLKIEDSKVELDQAKYMADAEAKQEQIENQKKMDYLKLVAELLGIGLPLVFYGVYLHKGFKLEYEDKGMICSPTFKNLISNFKPKRK